VMEVYRGLENKAIYLNAPAVSGGSDALGWPNGIPNSTSAYYAAYHADSDAYGGTYYSYADPTTSPLWVTQSTTAAVAAHCPSLNVRRLGEVLEMPSTVTLAGNPAGPFRLHAASP